MKSKTFRSLVAATAVTGALSLITLATASPLAAPAGAAAVSAAQLPTSEPSWGGYYAVAPKGKNPWKVVADMTVPDLNPSKDVGNFTHYQSVEWAGIGGMNEINGRSVGLEQAGVSEYQARKGGPIQYQIFWEMVPASSSPAHAKDHINLFTQNDAAYPAPQVKNPKPVTVKPHDHISILVWNSDYNTPDHNEWFLSVTVNGQQYDTLQNIRSDTKPGTTAEVITEWPSGKVGMINTGAVHYTNARFTYSAPNPFTGVLPPVTTARVTQHYLVMQHRLTSRTAAFVAPSTSISASFTTYFFLGSQR